MLDYVSESKRSSQVTLVLIVVQEIITGNVPYSEYRTEMGIYRAIHSKQPPRRPAMLSGPEKRADMMWSLLLECWDHDPHVRPDATTVLKLVCFFITNY